MQVLQELPSNLAHSILCSASTSINLQLTHLPHDHHPIAVAAAFPEIASQGSLKMDIFSAGVPAALTAISLFPKLLASDTNLENPKPRNAHSIVVSDSRSVFSVHSSFFPRPTGPPLRDDTPSELVGLHHQHQRRLKSNNNNMAASLANAPAVRSVMLAFIAALQQCNPLHVKVNCMTFGEQFLCDVLQMSAFNTGLESLDIALPFTARQTFRDGMRFSRAIYNLGTLSRLRSLSLVYLEPSVATGQVVSALEQLALLTKLVLLPAHETMLISGKPVVGVSVEFLSGLESLLELQVCSSMGQVACKEIAEALPQLNSLTKLALAMHSDRFLAAGNPRCRGELRQDGSTPEEYDSAHVNGAHLGVVLRQVTACTSLRVLNLLSCPIEFQSIGHIEWVVRKLPHLEHMQCPDISDCRVSDELDEDVSAQILGSVESLLDAFSACSQLSSLSLSLPSPQFTVLKHAWKFWGCFTALSSLNELQIHFYQCFRATTASLSTAVDSMASQVEGMHIHLEEGDCASVSPVLGMLSKLTSLSLTGAQCMTTVSKTATVFRTFDLAHLGCLTDLQQLNIRACGIHFGGKQFSDESSWELFGQLGHLSGLENIRLSSGLACVGSGAAFTPCSRLSCLDLTATDPVLVSGIELRGSAVNLPKVRVELIAPVVDSLSPLTELQILRLGYRRMTSKCAKLLRYRVLPNLVRLRQFSIEHCDCSTFDLVRVLQGLRCIKSLEDLDLSGNTVAGGASVSMALNCLSSLRCLNLSSGRFEKYTLKALGKTLQQLPALRSVDLSFNCADDRYFHVGLEALIKSSGLHGIQSIEMHSSDQFKMSTSAQLELGEYLEEARAVDPLRFVKLAELYP